MSPEHTPDEPPSTDGSMKDDSSNGSDSVLPTQTSRSKPPVDGLQPQHRLPERIGHYTIEAVIGQGGWGQMMYSDGFQRQNLTPTLLGFLLSVALAIVLDLALVALERRLSPWAKAR